MKIIAGNTYFISDDFFQTVKDPYLKTNYESTKRPHYFAFQDIQTMLYWLVPCSTKVDKFEDIIRKKQERHKSTDSIKIVVIQDKKTVLLFQDMFPIIDRYILEQYIRGGQPVCITDPKTIYDLEKTAKKIIRLLHHGIKFTPTQPDVMQIEKLMLEEILEAMPEEKKQEIDKRKPLNEQLSEAKEAKIEKEHIKEKQKWQEGRDL
ncbi:MAG: hypothetical protein PHQ50_01510 [Eubacteriales bacterium]|nr:hypothetical protein [Eubacteriales bacterium]